MKITNNFNDKTKKNKNIIYLFSFLLLFIFSCSDSGSSTSPTDKRMVSDSDFSVSAQETTKSLEYTLFTYGTISLNDSISADALSINNVQPSNAENNIKINSNPLRIEISSGLGLGDYTFDVVLNIEDDDNNYIKTNIVKSQAFTIEKIDIADDSNNFTFPGDSSTTSTDVGYSSEFNYGVVGVNDLAAGYTVAIANVEPTSDLITANGDNITINPGLAVGEYSFDVVITASPNDPKYKGTFTFSGQTLSVNKIDIAANNNNFTFPGSAGITSQEFEYDSSFVYGVVGINIPDLIAGYTVALANIEPTSDLITANGDNITINLGLAVGEYSFDVVITPNSNDPKYTGTFTFSDQTLTIEKRTIQESDFIYMVTQDMAAVGYSLFDNGTITIDRDEIQIPADDVAIDARVLEISTDIFGTTRIPVISPGTPPTQISRVNDTFTVRVGEGRSQGTYELEIRLFILPDNPNYTGEVTFTGQLTIN